MNFICVCSYGRGNFMEIPQIIKGIIFSEFDELRGPIPKNWTNPSISDAILEIVAKITLDTYIQDDEIIKTILIVPFPMIEMKGVVKLLEWPDMNKRGRKSYASLTLLYEDKFDPIFYKYLQDFEFPFKIACEKIINLKENYAHEEEIQIRLDEFDTMCNYLLKKLAEKELSLMQSEEFPSEQGPTTADREYCYKIIVVGDPTVGKTSTILRYTDKTFHRSYIPTIGVNITEKTIHRPNILIKLMIWDLAGQSKYQRIRFQFYQGSDGALLVYDLTQRNSFVNIEKWYEDMRKNIPLSHRMKFILIGNKSDRSNEIQVSPEEGRSLAKRMNALFFETSALSNENIPEVFEQFVESAMPKEKKILLVEEDPYSA